MLGYKSIFSPGFFFHVFVTFSFLLVVSEAIALGFSQNSYADLIAQIVLLTVSITTYAYGIFMTFNYLRPSSRVDQTLDFVSCGNVRLGKIIVCFDRDNLLELACYIIGIFFLVKGERGLAAIRILRIFRYLSYFALFDNKTKFHDMDIPDEKLQFSFFKAAKLCGFYMEQLFQEFATQKSSGGLIVMALFFFNAYIMAVIFTNTRGTLETSEGTPCFTLPDCFLTMVRLFTFDGTGYDYLEALVNNHDGPLVLLLFVFVIFDAVRSQCSTANRREC